MLPPRYRLSADYLASARDMGDAPTIASALRVFNAIRHPRTHTATPADMAMFREWADEMSA